MSVAVRLGKPALPMCELLLTCHVRCSSDKTNLAVFDKKGLTPLHAACETNFMEAVEAMFKHRAEDLAKIVSNMCKDGDTPLHIAVHHSYIALAKELAKHGADLNKQDTHDGVTALWIACQEGNVPLVECFVGMPTCDVNVADAKEGRTPLYIAAFEKKLDVVKILTGKKADLAKASNAGSSPLYAAASQEGAHLVVAHLLECGVDPNLARTSDGSTPICVAAAKGFVKTVAVLIDKVW